MNSTGFSSAGPRCFGTAQKKPMQDIITPDYPGPGTHEQIRFDKINQPYWSFGKDTERNAFLQQYYKGNPPPDIYNPNPQIIHESQPKITLPKSSYPQQQIDQNARYNYSPTYDYVKNKLPLYSFGYIQQMDYRTQTPPPNAYFHSPRQSTRFNKTQNFFTKKNRPTPYGQKAKFPGVGQYKLNQSLGGNSWRIGNGNRPDSTLAKDSPGIFYDIAGQLRKPGGGVSMSPNIPIIGNKDIPDLPAPNHYNPKQSKNIHNTISLSFRGPRSEMHSQNVVKYPSPDKYRTHGDIKKLQRQCVTFCQSERSQIKHNGNPAPDVYNIEPYFNKTLGHMARKIKPLTQFINPAPVDYKPSLSLTKVQNQRPINMYSKRLDFSKSVTGKKVGPGSYLKQRQWAKSELGKMSKTQKLQLKDNKVPGPGNYQISGTIGKLPKYYGLPRKIAPNGDLLSKTWTSLTKKNQKNQVALKLNESSARESDKD